jgi:hypothetical protein
MEKMKRKSLWLALTAASLVVIALGSLVTAGSELTQTTTKSWPFDVKTAPKGPVCYERLKQIHMMAMTALPTASEADKPNILRVLKASFACAAYDGRIAITDPPQNPLPAHVAGHLGARNKVKLAWNALHRPPALPEHPEEWPEWSACADSLEHGHD